MGRIVKSMAAISLLLCLCAFGDWGNAGQVVAKTKTAHMYQLKEQPLHSFQNITAKSGNMDLKITPSKDGKFYLSYKLYCYNSKNPLAYHIKDSTLYLDGTQLEPALYRYKKSSYAVYTSLMQATLFVPAEKLADITIHAKAADLSMRKISCQNVSIKTTVGDIVVSGVDSGKLQVQADVGDISFSDMEISGKLQAQTDSGDITASGLAVSGIAEFTANYGDIRLPDLSVSGKAQIKSKYGDVGLKINKKCINCLGVTMKTADGDLSVAKSLGGKKKRYKEYGWRYVKHAPANSASLIVSASFGDISLQ